MFWAAGPFMPRPSGIEKRSNDHDGIRMKGEFELENGTIGTEAVLGTYLGLDETELFSSAFLSSFSSSDNIS